MKEPKFEDIQARDTQVIDDIDPSWTEEATMVLDVGPNDGATNINSTHGDWFRELDRQGRYLGIEIANFKTQYLQNILMGTDIRDIDLVDEFFDCILCISVFEHNVYKNWGEIFEKLKAVLMPGGSLIIAVPYRQSLEDYAMRYPPPVGHIVFDITESTFEPFIEGLTLYDKRIEVSNTFDGDGASFAWASLRWLKRQLTRHPYRKSGETIMLRYKKG